LKIFQEISQPLLKKTCQGISKRLLEIIQNHTLKSKSFFPHFDFHKATDEVKANIFKNPIFFQQFQIIQTKFFLNQS